MRLCTPPCLCSLRSAFTTLLLGGACAAVRAQEMTPAA